MLVRWILLFMTLFPFIRAACDKYNGPVGVPECVLLTPYYTDYQWGTCLTDDYIKATSQGGQECMDRSATYCYYQCMIEIHHDNGAGPVFPDCSCSPNATTSTSVPGKTTSAPIPSWCFSPTGTDCSWYRDCLERYHPCPEDNYALLYAEKFCELYNEHYSSFSSEGQRWIDAVRKCLQVELVPVLRPWMHASCDEIKRMAFDSHPKCYTSPGYGTSVCDLGFCDLLKVFWTIKSAFLQSFKETSHGLIEVFETCPQSLIVDATECIGAYGFMFYLIFVSPLRILRIVRSAHPENRPETEILVQKIISAVAENQRWNESGILWYGRKSLDNGTVLRINFMLASRKEYDLNADATTPTVNLTHSIEKLQDDVVSGKLSFSILDETVRVLSMGGCDDIRCNVSHVEATAVYTETRSNEGSRKTAPVSLVWTLPVTTSIFLIAFRSFLMCVFK